MNIRSVRFRLTVWYAVLLLAALVIFSGTIWLALRARLMGELDENVAERSERFRNYFIKELPAHSPEETTRELEEYSQAFPPSTYLDLKGSTGYEFRHPLKRRSNRKHRRSGTLRFASGGQQFTLQMSVSTGEIDHTLELLQWLLLSLSPAVMAAACLGGAWMSRRALRPVDEITNAAQTIGIENLAQRLPVPATGDELERLTRVWNTMLGRLESAVRMLSQFAADASHELRTPLAIIRTSAELALRRERTPEAYRESLVEIEAESERMTQLVENLLFLARGQERNSGMRLEGLDVSDIVRDVVGELEELGATRGIGFELHTQPLPVTGDRAALRRLFLALADNAMKYSPDRSTVKIDFRNGGVEVSDQGIGIGPADLPHIFQRFDRGDKARTGHGHGLGLSLAAAIAAAHGGRIEVESTEGSGSVFRVFLPSITKKPDSRV